MVKNCKISYLVWRQEHKAIFLVRFPFLQSIGPVDRVKEGRDLQRGLWNYCTSYQHTFNNCFLRVYHCLVHKLLAHKFLKFCFIFLKLESVCCWRVKIVGTTESFSQVLFSQNLCDRSVWKHSAQLVTRRLARTERSDWLSHFDENNECWLAAGRAVKNLSNSLVIFNDKNDFF